MCVGNPYDILAINEFLRRVDAFCRDNPQLTREEAAEILKGNKNDHRNHDRTD